MEYINKIEIQGYAGSPSFNVIVGKKVVRFPLAVKYTHTLGNIPVTNTDWFSCIAFEGEGIDFSAIQAGNAVNVVGRVVEKRYVDSDGGERRYFEVICQSVKLAKENE